uniref:Uncharacterized protein n=1 Tax=Meloidogyne javanica TaxID=6303 RepID=A0A915MD08_MELJA
MISGSPAQASETRQCEVELFVIRVQHEFTKVKSCFASIGCVETCLGSWLIPVCLIGCDHQASWAVWN